MVAKQENESSSENETSESDESVTNDVPEKPLTAANATKTPVAATDSGVHAKRRPRRKQPLLRKATDFERFDRPDMFVEDVYSMFGMELRPDQTGAKPDKVSAFNLPADRKVLRMSVEGGIPATCRELFEKMYSHTVKEKQLPEKLEFLNEAVDLAYECPNGDELAFGAHSQDIQWIGDRFLGSIYVSHHQDGKRSAGLDNEGHESPFPSLRPPPQVEAGTLRHRPPWQEDWTFRTWHKNTPFGSPQPVPAPKAVRTRKVAQRKLDETVDDDWETDEDVDTDIEH